MISRLCSVHNQVKKYLDSGQNTNNGVASKVSSFWADIFSERLNFPDVREIQTFRRNSHMSGIGDCLDVNRERQRCINFIKLIRQYVPSEFICSLKEPLFGAPYVFEYDDTVISSSFVMNSGITWRCKVFADKLLSNKKSLNICDIGAGWGGAAYQLHSVLDINSCTIIDLPENLFLSSIYLQMTLEDKEVIFVEHNKINSSNNTPPDNSLIFALPQYLHLINIKFDLILNSYSLQEMDKETTKSYIEWIYNHLTPGGFFISINAHNKVGIKRAHEYGFQNFKIHGIRPFFKTPTVYFSFIPYEIVLSQKNKNEHEYSPVYLDALCEMIQLGLDGDISTICDKYTKGILNINDNHFLENIYNFFNGKDVESKFYPLVELTQFDEYKSITYYLQGNLLFAVGEYEQALETLLLACENGLRDFARTKALTMICSIINFLDKKKDKKYDDYLEEADCLSPNLSIEIREIIDNPSGIKMQKNFIVDKINLEQPSLL